MSKLPPDVVAPQAAAIAVALDRDGCRLFVDTTREGVDVPEFIRKRWGTRCVLDLYPSYPLHPEYTQEVLAVSLVTQNYAWRAVLPWESIWAVIPFRHADKDLLMERLIPADVKEAADQERERVRQIAERDASSSTAEPPTRPIRSPFRVIEGGKGKK